MSENFLVFTKEYIINNNVVFTNVEHFLLPIHINMSHNGLFMQEC